jgi:acyl-coenzyme A thioesterase PaaI-like protein
MDDQPIPLPKLRGYYCFGCGTENPRGLNMTFYRLGNAVCSDITLPRELEGWQNMAHGGSLSTVLDEIMSWAVIAFERVFFVTGRMEVVYRRPAPVGVPLTARGVVSNEPFERGCVAKGEILDANGEVLTRARAEMVYLPAERLTLISDDLKADMTALFAQMATLCSAG